jgi:hypothetical protein
MKQGTEKKEQRQKAGSTKQSDKAGRQNMGKQDQSNSEKEEKPSHKQEAEHKKQDVQKQTSVKQDPNSSIGNDAEQKHELGTEEKKHWDDEPEKEKPDGDKEPHKKIHTTRPDEEP